MQLLILNRELAFMSNTTSTASVLDLQPKLYDYDEEIAANQELTDVPFELPDGVTVEDWDKTIDNAAVIANKYFSAVLSNPDAQVKFAPKGSRCVSCKKKYADCSKLDFSKMRKLEEYKSTTIVICSEYERGDK